MAEENPCFKCMGCCRFKEEDRYFATLFTKEEVDSLKAHGKYMKVFKPYRKSSKVFQIDLIRSKAKPSMLVCPYLDEKTHICSIYSLRPFDCRFWPFLFMRDQEKKHILLSYFQKDVCQITDKIHKEDFAEYTRKNLDVWLGERQVMTFIRKYPELIWDYEADTDVVQEIEL